MPALHRSFLAAAWRAATPPLRRHRLRRHCRRLAFLVWVRCPPLPARASSGMRRRPLAAIAGLAVLAAVLPLVWSWASHAVLAGTRQPATETVAIGGPFELVDQTGRTVTDRTYRGRWLPVFFGYTNCPDVCPVTLGQVGDVLDGLGPLADKVQRLFVTVDPERDTPAVLADYLGNVDPRIVGLGGTPDQIAAVARAYRIYYARVKVEGALGYAMDHSAIVYLMGPDGRYREHFSYQTGAERMTAALRSLLKNP